jgi:hypothetical protein
VADPAAGAQTLFLHVFEIGQVSDRQAAPITLVGPAAVDIGGQWRVEFNVDGPLGGRIGDRPLARAILTEAQYSAR